MRLDLVLFLVLAWGLVLLQATLLPTTPLELLIGGLAVGYWPVRVWRYFQ